MLVASPTAAADNGTVAFTVNVPSLVSVGSVTVAVFGAVVATFEASFEVGVEHDAATSRVDMAHASPRNFMMRRFFTGSPSDGTYFAQIPKTELAPVVVVRQPHGANRRAMEKPYRSHECNFSAP